MYLMIAIWGHEGRGYASMKFFYLYPSEWPDDVAGDFGIGHAESQ